MEKKCKKCRRVFTYTESDIADSSRDYKAYGESIHSNYQWVKCPHCGNVIFLGESGWSV